jgi:hypothetical protein
MEIYLERVRDLLNPVSTNLNIREDAVRGIWIEGAFFLPTSVVALLAARRVQGG